MEQNPPVLAKKVWNLMRVVYSMLRKNISKRKILLDLNMMIKRGKIAGKALQDRMFNHHHHHNAATFSANRLSHTNSLVASNRPEDDVDMMDVNAAMLKAIEMIHSESASPALPGFGRSPKVRQLRVTDSPFPLSSLHEDDKVDEEAERFISRFYDDLRRQNTNVAFGSS